MFYDRKYNSNILHINFTQISKYTCTPTSQSSSPSTVRKIPAQPYQATSASDVKPAKHQTPTKSYSNSPTKFLAMAAIARVRIPLRSSVSSKPSTPALSPSFSLPALPTRPSLWSWRSAQAPKPQPRTFTTSKARELFRRAGYVVGWRGRSIELIAA